MKQLLPKEITISYTTLLLIGILCIAAFLLFYRIYALIPFIGDQGWFYLSAREMLLTGKIPLVGITASHPWLHQGAFWTYLLAIMLKLFNFDPISGAYLTALFGLASVYLIYYVGKLYFSTSVGIIASILYAISPLVIATSRMPYHTSPIPFFTLLFMIALYKWIKGNVYYFILCIFLLVVLYNFELATTTLGMIFGLLFLYGLWKKTEWFVILKNTKVIMYSILAFVIPMIPMLLYDIHHGFPQTFKFAVWIMYHILLVFGFPSIHHNLQSESWNSVVSFAFNQYQLAIFAAIPFIAFIIFLGSFGTFYYHFYSMMRQKKYHTGTVIIGIFTILLILGFLANRTTSGAYVPDIFPFVILLTAFVFDQLKSKYFVYTVLFILIIAILNTYTLLKNSYYVGVSYADRLQIAKNIINEAQGKSYNIVGYGSGSQFESYTMAYQYLTWWLGNGPSQTDQPLRFIIEERPDKILLTKQTVATKK